MDELNEEKRQLLADIDTLANQRAILLAELAGIQIVIGQAKADKETAIREANIAEQATKTAVLGQLTNATPIIPSDVKN